MYDFLRSSELWSNILGGVASALILAGIYWAVNFTKRNSLNNLVLIEKEITLLFEDEHNYPPDPNEWDDKSKSIYTRAIMTAKKISPSAGALIETIDVYYKGGDQVDHWYPILEEINKRIKIILEAHI